MLDVAARLDLPVLAPLAVLALLALAACGSPPSDGDGSSAPAPAATTATATTTGTTTVPPVVVEIDPAVHRAEVEAWQRQRDERLRQPDGWLSLVGLEWLPDAEEAMAGSAPESAVRFPAGAPEEVGTFRRGADGVTFAPARGLEATIDGEPIAGPTPLVVDTAGEPTEVAFGSFRFHLIEREGRIGVRIKDAASPTLTGFAGMESWPIDPAWRLVGRFVPTEGRTISVPNILGEPTTEPSPGAVELEIDGETYRIDAMEGGGELFLVFADATNGEETYGGGRFLYSSPPDAEGRVVVDFNKAYNPPCVFTLYATCPLPPPQNRLPVPIRAGEKAFAGAVH